MESWRGQGRQAGRDALARLATAWKAGSDPGGGLNGAGAVPPQVVGRVIRLHPLAIILSLAVGSVLAGIAGAVVAVPIVAVITRAVPELRRRDPAPGGP